MLLKSNLSNSYDLIFFFPSGQEVGPLLMNITHAGESNQSSGCNSKEPQIDTEVEVSAYCSCFFGQPF